MWKLKEVVYQDAEKILQFPEVTSVAVEYVELDKNNLFIIFIHLKENGYS